RVKPHVVAPTHEHDGTREIVRRDRLLDDRRNRRESARWRARRFGRTRGRLRRRRNERRDRNTNSRNGSGGFHAIQYILGSVVDFPRI
ncbi:MAG TPA: hypothetical protein VI258_06725, partial [Rhodanobacteraceae bacterium]